MSDVNSFEKKSISRKSPIEARLEGSDLMDERPQKISLFGSDSYLIADVNIDSNAKKIKINFAEKTESNISSARENIYISVVDAKGNTIYQKELLSSERNKETIDIPFEVGYKLNVNNTTPILLDYTKDLSRIIDPNAQLNTLVMTPLGVTNAEIESYLTDIIEADFIHPNAVARVINADIIEPAPTAFVSTTSDRSFSEAVPAVSARTNTGIELAPSLIEMYQLKLLGLCDYDIATVTIDEENKLAGIKIVSDSPHCYFGDELYASIKVTDRQGNITLEEKLYGSHANILDVVIPFKAGYKIDIFHQEPSRLLVSSDESDTVLSESKHNYFIMNRSGFEKISPPTDNSEVANNAGDTDGLVQLMSATEDINTAPAALINAQMNEVNKYTNIYAG